ncbi:MAG TPA: hypothetical protein VIK89_10560 [Cytophagaceae bacterium]
MQLSKEEFESRLNESQDILLNAMANDPEIDLEKFYTMTCILENITFFSGIIYSVLKEKKEGDY